MLLRKPGGFVSAQHVFHYAPVDVGEAVVAALVRERQALVVDAELVHDGGLQIVNVHRILGDVDAVVVCLAVGHAAAHATTGHPVGETVGMMVAPVIGARNVALAIDSASEFPDTNHQGILKEPA